MLLWRLALILFKIHTIQIEKFDLLSKFSLIMNIYDVFIMINKRVIVIIVLTFCLLLCTTFLICIGMYLSENASLINKIVLYIVLSMCILGSIVGIIYNLYLMRKESSQEEILPIFQQKDNRYNFL